MLFYKIGILTKTPSIENVKFQCNKLIFDFTS